MGLDMYLYREQYVSGYTYNGQDISAYNKILEATGLESCEDSPHATVSVCVAYWRKANSIHGYFVDNFAGGVDECQRISVSIDQLKELRDKCDSVLLAPANSVEDVVEENGLLPRSGFFFGSYGIDQWYMEDMKNTVKQIDKILSSIPADANPWDYSFYYQASW
jgi:hypothetical protein